MIRAVDENREELAGYALKRLPTRTYISRCFELKLPTSRDFGERARYVVKVFDSPTEWVNRDVDDSGLEWTEDIVFETPAGRRQVKFQVARQAGQIRQIEIEEVRIVGGTPELAPILRLDRDGAKRFIDLARMLDYVTVEGGESTVRIDDQTIRDILGDSEALNQLYASDPTRFRELIRADASADDVVALAHRRRVVNNFRELLSDPAAFALAQAGGAGGPEAVWQRFLEQNPWILGVGLAGQLLTSWDAQKLERVVTGASVAGPGKRVDALLETSGRIRSLVFAEIKHHNTELVAGSEYRSGCWAPSSELSGAVVQAQQTVDLAVSDIGARLARVDEDGAETGDISHVVRPRSFLIVGQLDQLRGSHGVNVAKYRSFELYRRNLYEPEILTFDELLARAEWHVTMAENESTDE